MHDLFKKNIFEKGLICEGDNVLIGFSGGPDSVFLFHNLRLLKESLSFNLYASHINHMYRGEAALRDEDFVREICMKYGIKLFVKQKNTADYAVELKVTEEEAGRILRYGFFRDNLKEVGSGKIAVAHNLNDQSETILQRIIRGTGTDGLSAMTYIKDDVIRPILNVSRKDIEKYLHDNDFGYCTDLTNAQPIYGRNKIRLNLIPYLEQNFNHSIQNTLFRMSEVMESDKKIIEKYTVMKFEEVLLKYTSSEICLDLHKLKSMEDWESGRVIRHAVGLLKGNNNNIEVKHINYALEFIKSHDTGKKINLSDGITVQLSYNNFIVRKNVEKIANFEYNNIVGQALFIEETGQTVICDVYDVSEYDPGDKSCVSVDYDKVSGSVNVRNRRSHDSIIPCGMKGSKKIKDIFINMKIPVDERDKKLIISDDNNVIWVDGFRIHNDYKVSSSTKKILKISVVEERHEK